MEIGEARAALADWKRTADRRDEILRGAYRAGVTVTEISQITGVSRTTIYKILGLEPGDNPPLSASAGTGAGPPE